MLHTLNVPTPQLSGSRRCDCRFSLPLFRHLGAALPVLTWRVCVDTGAADASKQTYATRRLSVLVTDSARRARLLLQRVRAVPCPWSHPFTSPAVIEPYRTYACTRGEAALLLVSADGRDCDGCLSVQRHHILQGHTRVLHGG